MSTELGYDDIHGESTTSSGHRLKLPMDNGIIYRPNSNSSSKKNKNTNMSSSNVRIL